MTTDYRVEAADLWMRYPDRNGGQKTVLNGLDLRVRAGEFVTVVGPTGCGKSTLLKTMLGSESPTSGQILVNGSSVAGVNRDRGIVFQKYSLFPHLSVIKNIMFGLELEHFYLFQHYVPSFLLKRKREFRDRAMEFLKRIELQPADAEKRPDELSGGMQQRVAIAQALIMEPQVLLMDEPFGALDPSTREKMQLFILERQRESKMTIFFVTHDLEEALFLGTRTVVLSQHWLENDGRPGEGAKIVMDKGVPAAKPDSTELKYSEEFNKLLLEIRSDGLDPSRKKLVKDFDLSHPDAVRQPAPVAKEETKT